MLAYRILLIENDSALAQEFCVEFEKHNFRFDILPKKYLQGGDEQALKDYWSDLKPNLILDTACVAGAESCLVSAAHQQLLNLAHHSSSHWIHLSSSSVFSADGEKRFAEDDATKSYSGAAKSLIEAEARVVEFDKNFALRVPWLIGGKGDTFLSRVCEKLTAGKEFDVSDKAYGTPVSYEEVIRVVIAMIQQIFCGAQGWGIYHVCSSEPCSEAEFVDCVARLLNSEGEDTSPVNIVSNENACLFTGSGCLSGARLMSNFGVQQRTWRQGLKRYLHEWKTLNS